MHIFFPGKRYDKKFNPTKFLKEMSIMNGFFIISNFKSSTVSITTDLKIGKHNHNSIVKCQCQY